MAQEGPGGAADSEFMERAYPDTTISVAEMNGAQGGVRGRRGSPVPRR